MSILNKNYLNILDVLINKKWHIILMDAEFKDKDECKL